ncbi:sensor histidine kinase [Nocardiopsis synnemataformans]|uniref:sensor histidine kinase n=1 Tax=Nocardiopsis synnemataformans TaxID=61305 RepID=UPI003EBBFC64
MDTTPDADGADTAPGGTANSGERRGPRGWVLDALLFLGAALTWAYYLLAYSGGLYAYVPSWLVLPDLALGAVACLALWWRRGHPLGVGVLLCLVQAVSSSAVGALAVALINLAVRRPWRQAAVVAMAAVLLGLPWIVMVPPTRGDSIAVLVIATLFISGSMGWGVAIRTRRQLIERLRADVRREREERGRRLAAARTEERQRIAREMHDVVAHRMSLLSVHAGALAYRIERAERGEAPPLENAELGAAVRVIRDNAHQALEELGGVLSVLRAADTAPGRDEDHAGTAAPQPPALADVTRLVEEAVRAGQRVRSAYDVPEGAEPPGQVRRTAYRLVQEGLTNTRKHAPGARVDVRISGAPGHGLEVSVVNPLPVGVAPAEIPGVGAGLTGLSERVALDGGTLRHGPEDGVFRLLAALPWPETTEVP